MSPDSTFNREREGAEAPRPLFSYEEAGSAVHVFLRSGGAVGRVRRAPGYVIATLPDVFQDGFSAGSLVQARRQWIELENAELLHLRQHFDFAFHCPTRRTALGLVRFLGHARYAALNTADPLGTAGEPWHVSGSTRTAVWSLATLEHLFMRLRGAGPLYGSTLVALDLGSVR